MLDFFLAQMDQNYKMGGYICCRESHFEFLLRQNEVLILRTRIGDAAGAFRVHSGKGPG